MKRVRGRSLQAALEQCASLEDRLALLPHLVVVVQTLAYAHARGVVHRDLKPANIMVGQFGETQVLDWGLARSKGEPDLVLKAAPDGTVTQKGATIAGHAMGTPTHMSPEQAHGRVEEMDEKSDVWSLGVLLYEVLTGLEPFKGATALDVLANVKLGHFEKVRSVEPKAPAALVAICERALSVDRARRYQSAVQMAEALEEATGAFSQSVRRPVAWIAGAFAAASLAAVMALLWSSARSENSSYEGQARRAVEESKGSIGALYAERAQDAWDRGDVRLAGDQADLALSYGNSAVARGVKALVRLSGTPVKNWGVTVQAGCSAIAARGGIVACSTLSGLEFFKDTGETLGTGSAGPSGWQRSVLFLDDRTVVTAGDDRLLRLWNTDSRELRVTWKGHASEVKALAVSADGSQVASGSQDGEVWLWSRDTGTGARLTQVNGFVRALAFGQGVLAVSGRDSLKVVPLDKADAPAVLEVDRPARALAYLPGNVLLAGIGRELWSLSADRPVQVWGSHDDDLTALTVSPTLGVLSGATDGTVKLWDRGHLDSTLTGFDPGVASLAVDGQIFVATRDRALQAWKWSRDNRRPELPEANVEPLAWAVASDGVAVFAARDGSVHGLSGPRVALPAVATGFAMPSSLETAKGSLSIAGSRDGQVVVIRNGTATPLAAKSGVSVRATALAANGERAAWSTDDGTLVVWSLQYSKEIFRQKDMLVNAITFSADGLTLALARDDKRVGLRDAQNGKELALLEGHDGRLFAVAFSPDGTRLASAGGDKKVALWDLTSRRVEKTLTGPADRIGSLSWSADGQQLAAGSDDGSIYVWKPSTGALSDLLRLRAGDVEVVGFVGPGRLFAAGSDRSPRWLTLEP